MPLGFPSELSQTYCEWSSMMYVYIYRHSILRTAAAQDPMVSFAMVSMHHPIVCVALCRIYLVFACVSQCGPNSFCQVSTNSSAALIIQRRWQYSNALPTWSSNSTFSCSCQSGFGVASGSTSSATDTCTCSLPYSYFELLFNDLIQHFVLMHINAEVTQLVSVDTVHAAQDTDPRPYLPMVETATTTVSTILLIVLCH